MSDILRFTLVQTDIIWNSVHQNLKKIDTLLASCKPGQTDLIILPEMFATGFIMQTGLIENNSQQQVIHWMKEVASRLQTAIIGTHPFIENGMFYNRALLALHDGTMGYYDKKHLFSVNGEDINYTSGQQRKIFTINEWKILPVICYDLRFPVWCRNSDGYDVLLCMANWPSSRNAIWEVLLKARAIENQSFAIGVNRTGRDNNKIRYSGYSLIVSADGKTILKFSDAEQISTIELNRPALLKYRSKFPVLKDADHFKLL